MYRDKYYPENKSPEWATPIDFFEHYNRIFNFTIDVAASKENAKCEQFYTIEDDGVTKNWGGQKVWCNPPYGRSIGMWVQKCYEESLKPDTLVVALLPVRTDTRWFQCYIKDKALTYFVPGRLRFNNTKGNAPFASMVCIWGMNYERNK